MKIALRAEQDVQYLATFVHGVLAALHALGIAYNVKRRNWFDVAAHSAAMTYDIWATAKHLDALGRLTTPPRITLIKPIQALSKTDFT